MPGFEMEAHLNDDMNTINNNWIVILKLFCIVVCIYLYNFAKYLEGVIGLVLIVKFFGFYSQ